jgi:hypothetical protein
LRPRHGQLFKALILGRNAPPPLTRAVEKSLLPIEVKATENPGYNDSKGLRTFRDEYGAEALGGLLLHGGERTYWISDGVLATPWWKVI